MRPPFYLRRLRDDVAGWVDKGLISASQGEAVLADAGLAGRRGELSGLLVVLGAILAGAAAVTFVAANWEDFAKPLRLAVLLGALGGAWALAARFFARGETRTAQAFVLLATGLFGASVMLVGQTYHLNADYPGGILLWALGALGAAAFVPSRTALGAALVLGLVWTGVESVTFTPGLHLAFAPFWLAASGIAFALRWRGGAHLLMLSLLFWLAVSVAPLSVALDLDEGRIVAWIGAGALAAFAWGLMDADKPWRIVAHYGALVFLATGFLFHAASLDAAGDWARRTMAPEAFAATGPADIALALIAAAGFAALGLTKRAPVAAAAAGGDIVAYMLADGLLLALVGPSAIAIAYWVGLIAVIAIGVALGRPSLVNLGLVAFAGGVLNLYFETFGGLLQTSLVFLFGALLLFALAFLARFAGKRLAGKNAP